MHLLYLTFGKDIANHIQAAFSICSFLTQDQAPASINVITDEPSFYRQLASQINVITVDQTQLEGWKGPHKFMWRIKIKTIEKICTLYPNQPVVYLDTDTFLYRTAAQLRLILQQGTALMHEKEGPLSAATSKTEKKMWGQVKNQFFGGIQIKDQYAMWNAGMVATPNTKNAEDIRTALQICDDMCASGVTKRLIEQFALSVALQHSYGLVAGSEYVAHYWSNKAEWNVFIAQFFMRAFLQNQSLAETINGLKEKDFSTLPVVKKTTNTNQRLQKKIDQLFPARDLLFVTNQLNEKVAAPNF